MAKAKKEVAPKPAKEPKKDRDVKLNFFQLGLDNLTSDYENAERIRTAFKLPPKPFVKTKRDDDSRISLFGKKFHSNPESDLLYGTLIHNQTKDFPFGYDDDEEQEEKLQLKDNQGLGYPTFFLYDPIINLVVIESAKNCVGIGDFCVFFENNLSLPSLDAAVVINPTEISKLNNMKSIVSFDLKIARLRSASPFKDKNMKLSQIVKAADNTNTDTLEVKMSVGYFRSESLDKNTIIGYVKEALRFKTKENKDVKKLIVSGRSSDGGGAIPIDLIKERLHETIKVELVRQNTIGGATERYRNIYSAYVTHKKNLHEAYAIKKE